MKAYIVCDYTSYEGPEILGVYSERAAAEYQIECLVKHPKASRNYRNLLGVEVFDIGAPVDVDKHTW